MARLVSMLVAAALLAGCSLLPGATPDGPVRDLPAEPPPNNQPPAGAALRVSVEGGMVGARPVAVNRFLIGPDGRTVVIEWWGGTDTCYGLDRVELDRTGDVPRITAWEGTRPEAVIEACFMIALLKTTVVVLDAPILADGSGGEPVAGEPQIGDGALPVAPVAGIQDPRPHAVHGFVLSADGTSLTVHYVGGTEECYGLAAVEVEWTDAVPSVTILEGSRPGVGGPCIDIGVAKAVSISLDRPILAAGE